MVTSTPFGGAVGGWRRRTSTGPWTSHPLLLFWAIATVGLLFFFRQSASPLQQPALTRLVVPTRVRRPLYTAGPAGVVAGNKPAYMAARSADSDESVGVRTGDPDAGRGPRHTAGNVEGAAGDAVSSSTAEPITDPGAHDSPDDSAPTGLWSDRMLLHGSGLPHGKLRYDVPGRLVAIGDVHGDRAALVRALSLAGAVDLSESWIGGDLVIVQTGDNLDRGDEELGVISLLRRLQLEAARAGGAVHIILGNHEIMNAELDFRFVAESGFDQFATFANAGGQAGGQIAEPAVFYGQDGLPQKLPGVMLGRVAALRAGGTIAAAVLAERNVAIILRNTLFVHAGMLREHAERLDEINAIAASFLRGEKQMTDLVVSEALGSEDSMLWTRRWAFEVDGEGCSELRRALSAANVTRLVIGHTVQPEGITEACDGRVYRIDIGMGGSFAGMANRQIQLLEIDSTGEPRIIKGPTVAEDVDRSGRRFW